MMLVYCPTLRNSNLCHPHGPEYNIVDVPVLCYVRLAVETPRCIPGVTYGENWQHQSQCHRQRAHIIDSVQELAERLGVVHYTKGGPATSAPLPHSPACSADRMNGVRLEPSLLVAF